MLASEVTKNKTVLEHTDKPHVVLVNEKDDFIDTGKTINEFRKKIRNLLILEIKGKHFPKDLSKGYFESVISKEDMKKVRSFVNKF